MANENLDAPQIIKQNNDTTNSAHKVNVVAGSVTVSGTAAVTQSGTWSTRTQDGSGNAITSHTAGSNRGLDTVNIGFTNVEFVRNAYASVNVTTSAYVELIASTAAEYHELHAFDSSGQTLKIAFGAAASEVDKIIVPPGGVFPTKIRVASGTRISIKAISATANAGEIALQLLG